MRRTKQMTKLASVIAVGLTISCGDEAVAPSGGELQVELAMVGVTNDPDGCSVAVDGGEGHSIFGGESETFSNIASGGHVVQLSGLAEGCTVVGDNPIVVSVSDGQTTETRFDVEGLR